MHVHGEVQLTGSLLAKDHDGNVPVELTAIQDPVSGKWYLATLDAAPAGYNATRKRLEVDTQRELNVSEQIYTETLNLATANQRVIQIRPPQGYVWRIKNIYLTVPPADGAASPGFHVVRVFQGADPAYNTYLDYTANFDKAITVQQNHAKSVTTAIPSDIGMQMTMVDRLVSSYDAPVKVQYLNNLGVTSTKTLTLRVIVESERVI